MWRRVFELTYLYREIGKSSIEILMKTSALAKPQDYVGQPYRCHRGGQYLGQQAGVFTFSHNRGEGTSARYGSLGCQDSSFIWVLQCAMRGGKRQDVAIRVIVVSDRRQVRPKGLARLD
jgi:hypothetical protein